MRSMSLTLQATTRLESQLLITPCMLKLMAADELIALENTSVLQQSGLRPRWKRTGRRDGD
ncbi:hypothetical protein BJY52DRAFT_1300707 [Lactarius psammicola]|nr:hypothetical protein BJY52DRAFT_1300707 [Lactarius psammicola]